MPKPVSSNQATEVVANPEHDRRLRRRFSAQDKRRILSEAEACTERGQLSVLLRRERLYSSQLATWRNHTIGFIFQSFNLIPVLTAFENVELPLLLTKLSKAQRRAHVETALSLVGLTERASHYPRQLSGGQEQRVAIARAIVTDPALILADEPTGDLDAQSADEILAILEKLNQDSRKTIVMVTHDPRAAHHAKVTRHLDKGILLPEGVTA